MGGNLADRWADRDHPSVNGSRIGREYKIVPSPPKWLGARMGPGPNDGGPLPRKAISSMRSEGSLRRPSNRLHRFVPGACHPTPITPLEREPCGPFDDLVHQGKIRYVGCSNFKAWLLARPRLAISDKLGAGRAPSIGVGNRATTSCFAKDREKTNCCRLVPSIRPSASSPIIPRWAGRFF